MSGRGRKRKAGERYPNGELKERLLGLTDEMRRHRAEAVGCEAAHLVEAGSNIGKMLLAGHVKQAHYDAALKLLEAWEWWRSLAAIPPRHPRAASYGDVARVGPRRDCDPEQWSRAKERFVGAINAVGLGMRWSAVECVVIDDGAPPRLLGDDHLSWRVRAALLDGLDRLAAYFGVDVRSDAA